MNTTVRSIVVSAATVAVLGLAGTATAADLTTPAHHQAVAAVAADTTTVRPAAAIQPVAPATYQQQTPASATNANVGVGTTGILLLGAAVWFAVKHKGHKLGWMICSFALGVLLAGGAIGAMAQNAVTSAVTAVSTLGGSLS